MLYRILWSFVIHQEESAIGTHMSPSSWNSLPSASPSHSSACHRAPAWVPWVTQQTSIGYLFYIRYYKFPCYCLHTSHLLPPTLPPHPQVCSLCLFLHCCPENKFISVIFLDSTYVFQYTIFIFLFLPYFTLYNIL